MTKCHFLKKESWNGTPMPFRMRSNTISFCWICFTGSSGWEIGERNILLNWILQWRRFHHLIIEVYYLRYKALILKKGKAQSSVCLENLFVNYGKIHCASLLIPTVNILQK